MNRKSLPSPSARALGLCIALVSIEFVFALGYWISSDHNIQMPRAVRWGFDLDEELRPPAIFSALQLWLLSGFAWACHRRRAKARQGISAYALAAAVALLLGVDELVGIHEHVRDALKALGLMNPASSGPMVIGGWHVRSWTVIYLPLTAVVGALLAWKLLRELPRDGTFSLLVVAALVFVGGAIGVENLNAQGIALGWHRAGDRSENLLILIEESMEMFGVTLAIYAFARLYFEPKSAVPNRDG